MTGNQAQVPTQPPGRAGKAFLKRLALAAALFGLLYSFYSLTYSAVFSSDDERYIFDTVESIAERGTMFLNQTTYIRSFRTSSVEPAQPFLAIPLYLVAVRLKV